MEYWIRKESLQKASRVGIVNDRQPFDDIEDKITSEILFTIYRKLIYS